MKKLVRNLFAVIAATALVGSLASCADSDAEDPFATTSTNANSAGGNGGAGNGGGDNGNLGVQGAGEILPGYKAAKITFDVTEDSTNDEDTVLLIKYDRSAAGADELIKVTNTDLTVKLNGTVIKTFDKINFALDEYGASFDDSDKNPIKNSANQKEYKDKLSIGKTVKKGDKVEVSFTRFVAEGSGLEAIGADPTKIQIALIDKNQNAGGKADSYYNELCKDGEYTSIFEAAKKEENNQQGGGGTGTPQQPTDGTGTGGQQPGGNGGNSGAATVTPVTYSTARKAYTVKLTKDISDASSIGYVLQIDNDGTKDANGLKIDISNLKLSVKVGNGAAVEKTFADFNLVPNQYANPAYGKTDNRKRLGLEGNLSQGTEITVQVLSATVSNSTKAPSIIFALQEDSGSYGMLGTESGDTQDIWLPAFAEGATAQALTKTSIISGIEAGDDVWGSGTKTTANANGTYTVVAAGAGEGGWGGNIAAIPVCFTAGDLTGFTHIVLEMDAANFSFGDSADYAAIELKVANADDSKTKVINATSLFSNGIAEIPLASCDFLSEATKV
ncbi:MAG: hypothetical protein IJJ71_10345 [Treponema sp.]|uniref:hypothetical protein n=1 Tax=Treponema sp. TaxID=166 RepID=UPI0025D4B329|nr:hypothetical protein [Treponema sp.]MBR0496559.1 hypothetical protein [Treponema sp.]